MLQEAALLQQCGGCTNVIRLLDAYQSTSGRVYLVSVHGVCVCVCARARACAGPTISSCTCCGGWVYLVRASLHSSPAVTQCKTIA